MDVDFRMRPLRHDTECPYISAGSAKAASEVATTTLDHVRAAFGTGISVESAGVLLAARDSGQDWEALTETVAAGLADHYGLITPASPAPRKATGLSAILSA